MNLDFGQGETRMREIYVERASEELEGRSEGKCVCWGDDEITQILQGGIMLGVRQEERKRYVVCMYYGCERCMESLEGNW